MWRLLLIIRGQLTKRLQSIVPDPSVYGTHSFRSGGASRAANSGISDRVFQRHGRWKSVAAKDGYVNDDMSSRLAVSKSLGLKFVFFPGFSQALYFFF